MLNDYQLASINWTKTNGLIPCIIQNIFSSEVLMHGYMNSEALYQTQKNKKVTFYSRTKKRLWTKGETSGNFLKVLHVTLDCDQDSILILVNPIGETCHLKNKSCFQTDKKPYYTNFFELEQILQERRYSNIKRSYTAYLHNQGINRISQKVGEEAVETVIAAINSDSSTFINESSDLIYHLLVLLHHKNINFYDLINNLNFRKNK